MIPLSVPNFEGNEVKYVTDAVSQGWVSTGGAYVQGMEEKIAEYIGAPVAVACQSGTAALHLSLVECGVGAGDLVFAPPLTFIAAVNPIRYVGADPVFIDCDDSLCMDPLKLEEFCACECELTQEGLKHKKTGRWIRAAIVVHVFGNMADMEKIMEVSAKYRFKVIEDATEALGSYYTEGKYAGRFAGTVADMGAYSFNGNKLITTGGGGMVVGMNEEALKHVKYLSTQAKDDEHFYIHHEVGYNYRMTNVQAAIGVAQLECLEDFIGRKNRNYDLYAELLKENKNVKLIPFRDGVRSNKWFYSLYVPTDKKDVRSMIMELQEKGIQSRPIWGLMHEQKPYQDCICYKIEKAKEYSEHIINLPCSTNISQEDIRYVCEVINEMFA